MKQKMLIVTFLLVVISSSLPAQVENKIPKLRISASGGLGYLTAKGVGNIDGVVDNEKVKQLEKDLRWVTHLNGDAHYNFWRGLGIGVKYIFHQTSGEAEDIIFNSPDEVHHIVSDISEKDYINYFGLSIGEVVAIGHSEKFFLTSSISVGYMWLRSEASMLYENILTTGGNVAMNVELGADYLLNQYLGIGINLGALVGNVNKVKMTNGLTTNEQKLYGDSRINASNLHLSLGLRYYLNR